MILASLDDDLGSQSCYWCSEKKTQKECHSIYFVSNHLHVLILRVFILRDFGNSYVKYR